MTHIRIERGDGWFRLTMEGHAGVGPYGADPVCAGLSALAYTGARMIEELDAEARLAAPPVIRLEPGVALLEGRGNRDGKEVVDHLGRFLLAGLRLMAESFPKAVSVMC